MPTPTSLVVEPATTSEDFYRRVMAQLNDARVPFLVGGAHALMRYTGIERNTKDFDVFVKREDVERAMAALESADCRTEFSFPHWLGKAICGDDFVDIIFSSGNAVATVDDEWFAHAPQDQVLGMTVKLSPAEEMLWSKAFIMERERFDGGDVNHLILRCGIGLDWRRLIRRFAGHWRVLLSHLVTFGFVYPAEHSSVPPWVMDHLVARLQLEMRERRYEGRICRGPLISRAQYLIDIEQWGYADARLGPEGCMSDEEVELWTAAIGDSKADSKSGAKDAPKS